MSVGFSKLYNKASKAFVQFFTGEVSIYPLAVLRILVCIILLAQAFAISGFLYEFYGEKAIIQNNLNEFFNFSYPVPRIHHLASFLGQYGMEFNKVVQYSFLFYIFSVSCLLIGWQTRIFAILTWLMQFVVMNSAVLSNYGIDAYMHYTLFYFSWMPIGRALSVDSMNTKKKIGWTPYVTISLRIFQLHMCFTYFVAGFGKSFGYMWWNGEAIWQAMMLPEYRQFDLSIMADYPIIAIFAAYFTLFIETFYPIFIWFNKIRLWWVGAIISLHLGIAVFQGLHLFGGIMLVLTLCVFGLDHNFDQYQWFQKVKKIFDNKIEPIINPNTSRN